MVAAPTTPLPAPAAPRLPQWLTLCGSVRGRSHTRGALPNQDCVEVWSGEGVAVAAVADGHGSPRCYRSDRGARLAVQAAHEILRALTPDAEDPASPEALTRQLVEGGIMRRISERWSTLVQTDLARDPLAPGAWPLPTPAGQGLGAPAPVAGAEEAGVTAPAPVPAPPVALPRAVRVAYGTTLIAVLVTPAFGAFLQLGDGDTLMLGPDGRVAPVFAPAPEHIANETSSLCGEAPEAECRCRLVTWDEGLPGLILLSTDGYANAFAQRDGFTQVAADIESRLKGPEGEIAVRRGLCDWLDYAARFSGDDVTAALIWPAGEDGATGATALRVGLSAGLPPAGAAPEVRPARPAPDAAADSAVSVGGADGPREEGP